MNKILGPYEFDAIPAGKVFATGVLPNSPEGIFMNRDGGELRWIAKKGYGDDWAIYCHWSFSSEEYIEQSGDKISTIGYILNCVNCSETVINKYRF